MESLIVYVHSMLCVLYTIYTQIDVNILIPCNIIRAMVFNALLLRWFFSFSPIKWLLDRPDSRRYYYIDMLNWERWSHNSGKWSRYLAVIVVVAAWHRHTAIFTMKSFSSLAVSNKFRKWLLAFDYKFISCGSI